MCTKWTHKAVPITFPLILQTTIIAQMMSSGEEGDRIHNQMRTISFMRVQQFGIVNITSRFLQQLTAWVDCTRKWKSKLLATPLTLTWTPHSIVTRYRLGPDSQLPVAHKNYQKCRKILAQSVDNCIDFCRSSLTPPVLSVFSKFLTIPLSKKKLGCPACRP